MSIENIFAYARIQDGSDKFFADTCSNPCMPERYAALPVPLNLQDFDMYQSAYRKVTIAGERTLESFVKFLELQHKTEEEFYKRT